MYIVGLGVFSLIYPSHHHEWTLSLTRHKNSSSLISQTFLHIQVTYGAWQITNVFIFLPSLPTHTPALGFCYLIGLSFGIFIYLFFKMFFLFIFLEGGGEGETGRETSISCLFPAPNWGPGPQPRHVPRPGIQPRTFQFAGWCPTHWATLVRAALEFLKDA